MWKQLFEEPPQHAVENLLSPKRKLMYGVFAFAPGTLLALYLNSVKNRMNRENEVLRQEHISDEMQSKAAGQQKDVVLMQMIEELRERIQQLEREARNDTIADKRSDAAATAAATAAAANFADEDTLPIQREVTEKLAKRSDEDVKSVDAKRTELPAFLAEYEGTLRPWLDRFDTLAAEAEKLHEKFSEMMEKRKIEEQKAKELEILERKKDEKSAPGIEQSGIRERIANRERDMIAQDVRAYKASAAQKPQ